MGMKKRGVKDNTTKAFNSFNPKATPQGVIILLLQMKKQRLREG